MTTDHLFLAFLRQFFAVHIPALCCRAKPGHGSSLSGCEGVSVPPGASDGTNFPRIFASIVGWCSIPRLSAGSGTSNALLLFLRTVDRFCLGRDSTRNCLCAPFWLFVVVKTGPRAQVENFFACTSITVVSLFHRIRSFVRAPRGSTGRHPGWPHLASGKKKKKVSRKLARTLKLDRCK